MKSLPHLLLAAALLVISGESKATDTAARFQNVSEVVSNWQPDQHLWVHGNLQLSEERLSELESWLDANGTNWTIVLMQNARTQRYDSKSGMTAVEFALGEGLSNRTGFGDLRDSRTGQANGAVFVLFLEERKFSYFASETYDTRSLGERYWVNRLDRPAIAAMRSGGRVADAAKDTVKSIDLALTKVIEGERNRERLAKIAKEKALEEAKLYVSQLSPLIDEAVARAAALRSGHPALNGAVVRPPVSEWKATLVTISQLVQQKDSANARKHFEKARDSISTFQTGIDQWEASARFFPDLEKRISEHPTAEGDPAIAGHLARAGAALTSSQKNHALGELLYVQQLVTAQRELESAERQYQNWLAAEAKRKFARQLGTALFILGVIIVLITLNRLRRPARKAAEELLTTWKSRLRGKFDTLFQLMDRTSLVVGSSADLEERGFVGTTEKLAHETIHGVDELFIMSSATDQVIEEVEELVSPSSPIAWCLNGFSSRRYKRAIQLLSSRPIGFDDEDRLEKIISPKSAKNTRSLLGHTQDYEPFYLSFEQLIKEYDARQQLAEENLGRLESGIDGLPITQQELSAQMNRVSGSAAQLAFAAGKDSHFPLVNLRQKLIPVTEEDLRKAASIGEADPVDAFENLIPTSRQQVGDALGIVQAIESFRAIDQPVIARSADELLESGRSVSWIDEAIDILISRIEQLSNHALEKSIAPDLAGFVDDLTRLKGTVISAKNQCDRANDELAPKITECEAAVAETRAWLSRETNIVGTSLLKEPGLSPDEKIALSKYGIKTALSALDHGNVIGALQDLDEVEHCLSDAHALMDLSRESVVNHADKHAELVKERNALASEVAPAANLLAELQTGYAPGVQLFSSRFGEEISGQQSITNCIERAETRLGAAGTSLEDSAAAFKKGELIRAYGLLETSGNELGFAGHQLSLIRDQHEATLEAIASNRKNLQRLESQLTDLKLLCEDRRTCQSTIDLHALSVIDVENFAASLDSGKPNPFEQLRTGESLIEHLNALEDGIQADWKSYEMTESASTGAKAALTFCNNYLNEARTDGITDSVDLSKAINKHGMLTAQLALIKKQLKKSHLEWPELLRETTKLTTDVGKVRSVLEHELAAARDSAEKIMKAAEAYSQLHGWRSSHKVKINRTAGASTLARAKQQLARGQYTEARKGAISALGEALRELNRANARESERARAAAAARRAAAIASARRSRSSFSSSSSSSSRSSFSSSSFSSGSGFSRSGW
ncbi:hypothetical protein VSU19_03660 [Verrucomicrobiales bacterium BCK34]|nr:hypothetical protein [Verrucomicrobiales bacterium BCK34]